MNQSISMKDRFLERSGSLFGRLDSYEALIVSRLFVPPGTMQHLVAATACRLGNGWLYLALPILLLAIDPLRAGEYFTAAGMGLIVTFTGYAKLKRTIRRRRPCETFPWLDAAVEVLDRYSFPSGHSMAAAIVAVPMFFFFPALALFGLGWWIVVAWCRVALGHHYPSDVAAGSIIGTLISLGCAAAAG